MPSRRDVVAGGLAFSVAGPAKAADKRPIYLSDMHFHSFFGPSIYHSRPLARTLADGQATLVSWSISGDAPWFDHRKTFKQHSEPGRADGLRWFQRELARIEAHMKEQGLMAALRPQDVDEALNGKPRIVLTVEGPAFIAGPADVQIAYDAGIRHLQLVHFIRNPFGDFQTSPPRHKGLTGIGKEVIAECNRLGVLIDLAHATPATVAGALAVSKVPMVWSHGSVTTGPAPHPGLVTWRARQSTIGQARMIAKAGGVFGLWAMSTDVGKTIEGYGKRLLQLADWLGDRHVAFGTDINGLARNFTFSTYAELRKVVDMWQSQGVPEQRIRRIASENYARVLKQAMSARGG
jgi:membrane dipeptidase